MSTRRTLLVSINYKVKETVARSVRHIVRAAKALVVSEPMAIFHAGYGKS